MKLQGKLGPNKEDAWFETKPGLPLCDEVLSIDYNRNGVSGVGHYAIIFKWKYDSQTTYRMFAAVFPCECMRDEDGDELPWTVRHVCNPIISVQNLDQLANNNAKWNYRGDHFHGDLCEVIQSYWDAGWPNWDPNQDDKETLASIYKEEGVEVIPNEVKVALGKK